LPREAERLPYNDTFPQHDSACCEMNCKC
jgi:hypothetical protein